MAIEGNSALLLFFENFDEASILVFISRKYFLLKLYPILNKADNKPTSLN